jgi:hypothetical protein
MPNKTREMNPDSRCCECRPPRISTPGVLWMAGPRMKALLDRLNVAQRAVTGPPPTRVSFSKIAEWRAGTTHVNAPQLDEAYRELLQSYLSGAFEHTLVFYLTNLAPNLSGETGLTGYRMRRKFLAARARTYSPDDAKEAGALFEAYLAPCWIHRAAAARWFEQNSYPLPQQLMTPSGSADGCSEEGPIVTRGTKVPSNEPGSISVAPLSPREKCNAWIMEQLTAGVIPGSTVRWKNFERDVKKACGNDVKGFSERNLPRIVEKLQQELRTKAIR